MNQQNFPRFHEPISNIALSQSETKYKNMRLMILTMFILSAVNCITLVLMDTFFYFSAYLPFVLIMVGYGISLTYETMAFYIVMAVLAIISIVPYLLCYIFSKKHVGWMIAALAMFSADTVLLLVDLVTAPDALLAVTLIFHVYIVVTLAMGVKYGLDVKKERLAAETVPADPYTAPVDPYTADASMAASDGYAEVIRTITVVRKKSFVGCAIPIAVYAGNRQVAMLKNGESTTFEATGETFLLRAGSTNGMVVGHVQVPVGTENAAYEISMKMGMVTNRLELTRIG